MGGGDGFMAGQRLTHHCILITDRVLGSGLGAGLQGEGWIGLDWAGLGWVGWAGLGWTGLSKRLGWSGLVWAGLGWAGLLHCTVLTCSKGGECIQLGVRMCCGMCVLCRSPRNERSSPTEVLLSP